MFIMARSRIRTVLIVPSKAQSNAVITAATGTIVKATLTATDTPGTNNRIEYYLSANNGVNFEGPVTSGTEHTFTVTGTQLVWRSFLIKRSENKCSIGTIVVSAQEQLITW